MKYNETNKKQKKNVICTALDLIGNSMAAKGSADLRLSSVSEENLNEILLTAIAENTIHSTKT